MHRNSSGHRRFAWIALGAIAFNALWPFAAPAAPPAREAPAVICSAHGALTPAAPAPDPEGMAQHAHKHCAFCSAGAEKPALAAAPAAIPAGDAAPGILPASPASSLRALARYAPSGPRAPPAIPD